MFNNTNSSILFDIEYLIKYPDLALSAFGIVTNIIHICFLFQNSKIFIFLIFITGADLLHVFTALLDHVWNIITYIDHKNCSGYLNYFDMIFKSLIIIFFEFSDNSGAWISIFMSFKWSWNHVKKIATWIFGILFVYVSLYCSIMMIIFAYILPYSPCSSENIAQKFLKESNDAMAQALLWYIKLELIFGLARFFSNLLLLQMLQNLHLQR
ncbi:hypothetical protein B9Z55_027007 [Caenorhabditis nigoni]|uniref:G-protein coupled receptors family 1 profile domain-containing protein n=1 Tax=Caenorhabditis nigoni TaxID=1611254 RepID=A0A2G5SI97_9PELO|nr:hypothetical protein B9Z55_027007 [Caenorhabditis nigoni]